MDSLEKRVRQIDFSTVLINRSNFKIKCRALLESLSSINIVRPLYIVFSVWCLDHERKVGINDIFLVVAASARLDLFLIVGRRICNGDRYARCMRLLHLATNSAPCVPRCRLLEPRLQLGPWPCYQSRNTQLIRQIDRPQNMLTMFYQLIKLMRQQQYRFLVIFQSLTSKQNVKTGDIGLSEPVDMDHLPIETSSLLQNVNIIIVCKLVA